MEQQNQQPIQEKTETKPSIKTNWKFIAIVVVVSSVVGVLLFWYVLAYLIKPIVLGICILEILMRRRLLKDRSKSKSILLPGKPTATTSLGLR